MKDALKACFEAEMAHALEQRAVRDWEAAWNALERAHVLSQSHAVPHTWVHWEMFKLGLTQRDLREVLGQVPRLLLAAPGSPSRRLLSSAR